MSTRTKALALSIFTVVYNLAEGAGAIFAAVMSGSTALVGFGLDSFVESLSGSVMIWRFWNYRPNADEEEFEGFERCAGRLVAWTFFILAAYVIVDAALALYRRESPETSLLGIAIGVLSMVIARYGAGSWRYTEPVATQSV